MQYSQSKARAPARAPRRPSLHGASCEKGGALDVVAGQAVVAAPGEWIRYSTPDPEGAEYVAICLPAFSPDTVHRDE